MEQSKIYGYDVDGFDDVTDALMRMINSYPGLDVDERFVFSDIPKEEGLTVIASGGSAIIEHHESITDHVWEVCAYPFSVVYRASGLAERRKIAVKEWMDTLSRWMTRQTVTINGEQYHLDFWPRLACVDDPKRGKQERWIKTILRQSPAYLNSVNEDKSENWVMDLVIQYQNEFDR